MERNQQIIRFIVFAILALFFLKCANQLSPTGGEKDNIPPTILSSYPQSGMTNFTENKVELSFSEYVNKRNINEAFFISPLVEELPEFSWTNKTVTITFAQKLDENTTYSIVIGTEITDVNNNNKMSEPFILTFSTGSKIDSGKISGKVYSKKADGTMIFAYKKDTTEIDIYKNKPNYVSQIDATGKYQIFGLGIGIYELFAVKDEFNDLIYNVGEDKIGLAKSSFQITEEITRIEDVNFFLFKEDTLAPKLNNVTMTDKNHIIVEFSEPIDSSLLSVTNFNIIDSIQNKVYFPKYLFKGNQQKSEYVLGISDSLNLENEHFLTVQNVQDLYRNIQIGESFSFIASDKPDTNSVKVNKVGSIGNSSQLDYLNPEIRLSFSDAFDTSSILKGLSLLDTDSNKVEFNLKYMDDANIVMSPTADLKPRSTYTVSTNLNYFIDIAGNKQDTVINNKINTISSNEFSGVSGKLTGTQSKNMNIVLENVEMNNDKKQSKLTANSTFEYNRVNPGKYLLWVYEDVDSNDSYSKGDFSLKKYAEPFKFFPDTLNLRPRWPIGDVEIKF